MRRVTGSEFRYVESCLDYQTFIAALDPAMGQAVHSALSGELSQLGAAGRERMGVIYVRGPWGFLVIPPPGFPELRVSFYHHTSEEEMHAMLAMIGAVLNECHAARTLSGD